MILERRKPENILVTGREAFAAASNAVYYLVIGSCLLCNCIVIEIGYKAEKCCQSLVIAPIDTGSFIWLNRFVYKLVFCFAVIVGAAKCMVCARQALCSIDKRPYI